MSHRDRTDWQVPAEEVDAVMRDLFDAFDVWRLYADPPYWQSWIAAWRGRFGQGARDRVVDEPPPPDDGRARRASTRRSAKGRSRHDGDKDLTRHLGNAQTERPVAARRAGEGALADPEGTAGLAAQDRLGDGGGV